MIPLLVPSEADTPVSIEIASHNVCQGHPWDIRKCHRAVLIRREAVSLEPLKQLTTPDLQAVRRLPMCFARVALPECDGVLRLQQTFDLFKQVSIGGDEVHVPGAGRVHVPTPIGREVTEYVRHRPGPVVKERGMNRLAIMGHVAPRRGPGRSLAPSSTWSGVVVPRYARHRFTTLAKHHGESVGGGGFEPPTPRM